jgi:hypothetical protein
VNTTGTRADRAAATAAAVAFTVWPISNMGSPSASYMTPLGWQKLFCMSMTSSASTG